MDLIFYTLRLVFRTFIVFKTDTFFLIGNLITFLLQISKVKCKWVHYMIIR